MRSINVNFTSELTWRICIVYLSQHGRMIYKDTKPYMSPFLSVDLLTDFAAFCLTDFIDWRYTHSWFVFSTQLVNCCPPWMGRNYTCVLLSVAPLLCLLSDLLPPFPMYSIYRQLAGSLKVFLEGSGVLNR
jgi:hypothetical protein